MKKKTLLKLSVSIAISMAALTGCSKGLKPSDPDVYRNKTGIIGVFRQSAFYCENVMPQYMTLGPQKIMVKSGWSNEQDNLFISEMKPGIAPLYSYEYSCGDDETRLKLDTTDNGKKAFPYAVKIPDQGFCKIVISFLDNDNLFSHNDALLKEYFERNEVAAGYPNIPYCDVIDTKGNVVTFMDRDSLNRELYAEAVKKAKNLTADDIYPLVSIEGSSDMASLSGDNSQVILVTWHNTPDEFKDGQTISHTDKVIWAFTDKEFLSWFRENHEKVDNWDLRLKQLIGMSPETNNNYFTVFWANVSDVFRPAYYPEINSGLMNTTFSSSFEEDMSENAMWFKNWFDKTSATIYSRDGGHPWTRLGYTYDWGNPDRKYGLSEFIVKEGAPIEVKFTRNNKAFLKWIKDRL
ncbi:hypothetical protein [Fibrobacter sp. UWH4]|uniref:hypothetical protein n=1 Tax=Fibrobacter sp. UWH4 TaxID=1896210 RepID=UPI00090FB41E|nr:hypothetical protein [Fibrobacter sp. UWH4]SHL35794.1 hypothetical protein SAMN05720762_105307 [Fibrobacter sp. UWH4]